MAFDDRPSQTIVVIAPVHDVGNGDDVVAEGVILEFVDDGLLFVVEPVEHNKELDGVAERSF